MDEEKSKAGAHTEEMCIIDMTHDQVRAWFESEFGDKNQTLFQSLKRPHGKTLACLTHGDLKEALPHQQATSIFRRVGVNLKTFKDEIKPAEYAAIIEERSTPVTQPQPPQQDASANEHPHAQKKARVEQLTKMQTHVVKRAKALSKLVDDASLTIDSLCDPSKLHKVPFPFTGTAPADRFTFVDKMCFEFMGRTNLNMLVSRYSTAATTSRITRINVYGTMGYGKSHMIAAFVALYMTTNKDTPIVYLPQARDLAYDPTTYLRHALALAFSRRDEELAEIAQLGSVKDMLAWTDQRMFVVVVDQMNSLEEDSKLMTESKVAATEIVTRLCGNDRIHILGFSANNETMTAYFDKQRSEKPLDLTFFGGFSEDEYKHWLKHHGRTLGSVDGDTATMIAMMTGRVPMSLADIVKEMKRGLDQTMAIQKVFINLALVCRARLHDFFNCEGKTDRLNEAQRILVGTTPSLLPHHRDHRYTFVNDDGKLATVSGIVHNVLTFYVRTRDDGKGGFLLSDLNVQACCTCQHPVERGTRAEAIAVSYINRNGLPMVQEVPAVSYFHAAGDSELSTNAVTHYVPVAFNYSHIDSLFRVLRMDKGTGTVTEANVYAIQYTTQKYTKHKHSLSFFDGDHSAWVRDLPDTATIHWHFVWVLTKDECSSHLEKLGSEKMLSIRGKPRPFKQTHQTSRRASLDYTEWFYAFHDIYSKLKI